MQLTNSMQLANPINRRILLASRPSGLPRLENFQLETVSVPTPGEGQILLRTLYLSLDPYMRNLMDEIGPGYAPSINPGEIMVGGTVNEVVVSHHPNFQTGELVLGYAGWQDYSLSDGSDLQKLGDMAEPSLALGGLGMTGFTAYVGLIDIAQPKAGETLVLAAATGAVGAVVGQIAKLKGLRVIGIAGGADKCRYAVQELGFDVCLDHRDPQLAEQLAAACPAGIDIYFESVGGKVFEAVLPLLNLYARIPVCGFIAHYNEEARSLAADKLPLLLATVLQKRIRMEGFIILDHYVNRYESFLRDMNEWIKAGKIKLRENKIRNLESAPAAFIGLLEGKNFGKLLIEVAER
jgi:NADPH-dependent curcumin reductase CurA